MAVKTVEKEEGLERKGRIPQLASDAGCKAQECLHGLLSRAAVRGGVALQQQAANEQVLGGAVAQNDGEGDRRRGRRRR
jgi:hypothetical protein